MDNSDKLSSWKEIANYLDVEIRTCQRWEQEAGLPVHRYTDTPRSRVFTTKKELDKWLDRSGKPENGAKQVPGGVLKGSIILALLIIVVISVLFIANKNDDRNPTEFRIINQDLVILN